MTTALRARGLAGRGFSKGSGHEKRGSWARSRRWRGGFDQPAATPCFSRGNRLQNEQKPVNTGNSKLPYLHLV